jgi:hypothetical protein
LNNNNNSNINEKEKNPKKTGILELLQTLTSQNNSVIKLVIYNIYPSDHINANKSDTK